MNGELNPGKACAFRVEGNPRGPTLVFIHGWPDDASLWRRQVTALGDDFRCVLVTLPLFGEAAGRGGGYDFPELVERLAETLREVSPDRPVGLVTHDWGAYLGYLLEQAHPDLIDRMAALDVGGHVAPENLKTSLMILGYQWALVACWLAGGMIPLLGNAMTRVVAKVVQVPARQRTTVRSRSNYLYFYLWRGLLLPWYGDRLLRRYRPRCPVLYLYGERKPLMFHSQRWLGIVEESGGRAVGVTGAGHWLQESHAEAVNRELAAWFR